MKSIKTSALMLTRYFVAILFGVLLSTDLLFSQPIWPDHWLYRKPVVITGTGTLLTDYQIKVELNASNFEFVKAQSNGGDIRFTDTDGVLELPYWIEEWASPVSATIWVRVPEIPADEKIIYLHYGVPRGPEFGLTPAVSTGSGTATFLFFDDFETGTIDPARWTAIGSPSVSVVDYNGNQVASFTGPGAPDGHNRYLMSNSSFDDFIMEMKVNMTADANDDCTPEVGFRITDNDNRYITMLRGAGLVGGGGPDGDLLAARIEGGVQTSPPSYPAYDYMADHFYDYRIAAGGTEISAWLDDLQVGTTWDDTGSLITSGAFSLTNYGGAVTHAVYFDDVRVRTYSDAEPVVILIFNEDKVWVGGSTNWNLADGWSPRGVPASGDNVTIPSNAGSPYITGSPFPVNVFTECANLTVGSLSTLTVRPSGDLTVNGNMTINGTIQVSSSDDDDGGSLIVYGTSTGTINFYRAFRSDANLGDRHFFASPVEEETISDFITINSGKISIDGTNNQIWQYQENDNSWPLVTSGSFVSGRGYNLDLASDAPNSVIRFRGTYVRTAAIAATSPYATGYEARANSFDYGLGNPDTDIWAPPRNWDNYGGGGWNLLGNPFTSAMDAAVFISENYGKFDPWYQALYLYDGLNNRYRYAASTVPGWEEPFYEEGGLFGDMVQAGQGFFVLALYDGIVFNFNSTTMQKHALPEMILLKSGGPEATWPGIKLIASSGGGERSTIVAYNDDMTISLDRGYDVALLSTNPDVEIYTSLMQKDNDVNFARQVLPLADCENYVIPVGIDTENGGEVTFSSFTIPLDGYKFWLEDRTTGVFTEIGTKSYTVTLPPKTYGTGRFFIIASANTPTGVEKPVTDETGLRIWTSNGQVIISGEVSERSFCEIYDTQGKRIGKRQLDDGELNTVELPSALHGVFIVRVIDGLKVTTRKVVIL